MLNQNYCRTAREMLQSLSQVAHMISTHLLQHTKLRTQSYVKKLFQRTYKILQATIQWCFSCVDHYVIL